MTLQDRIVLNPIASDAVRLNDWLDAAFAQSKVKASIAADLKLCVNEIFANLISYAFEETAHPEIVVEIELQTAVAKASVSDNGIYFDLRKWPVGEKPKNLTAATAGGFGIGLIRNRASRIDYDRIGGTNRIRVTCSGAAPETEQQGT